MINSRDLKDLHPTVAGKAYTFVERCRQAGIDLLVTSTYRDKQSQDALYAQGRSKEGKIITNAKGGQSFHNYRVHLMWCPCVTVNLYGAQLLLKTKLYGIR